jgi:hypothetical protein
LRRSFSASSIQNEFAHFPSKNLPTFLVQGKKNCPLPRGKKKNAGTVGVNMVRRKYNNACGRWHRRTRTTEDPSPFRRAGRARGRTVKSSRTHHHGRGGVRSPGGEARGDARRAAAVRARVVVVVGSYHRTGTRACSPARLPHPPRRTAGPWPVGRQHQHPTPPTPSNSSPRFPAIITRTCHRPASSPARFAAPGRHPRAAQANQPSPSRPPSPVDSSLSLSLSRLPAASAASRHRPIPPHPQPPSALARARRALSTADSTTSLYCFAPSSPISSGIASRGEGYFWCYC